MAEHLHVFTFLYIFVIMMFAVLFMVGETASSPSSIDGDTRPQNRGLYVVMLSRSCRCISTIETRDQH